MLRLDSVPVRLQKALAPSKDSRLSWSRRSAPVAEQLARITGADWVISPDLTVHYVSENLPARTGEVLFEAGPDGLVIFRDAEKMAFVQQLRECVSHGFACYRSADGNNLFSMHRFISSDELLICVVDGNSVVQHDWAVPPMARAFGFTKTETRIVSELLRGMSTEEIASESGSALSTVRTHIKRILFKARHRETKSLLLTLSRMC